MKAIVDALPTRGARVFPNAGFGCLFRATIIGDNTSTEILLRPTHKQMILADQGRGRLTLKTCAKVAEVCHWKHDIWCVAFSYEYPALT